MSHRQFAPLDYLIFGACLFISIGIGVYHAFKGRHNKSTNDYYFGGKTMGAIPVTLSLIVTYQSSVFLLGMPAELYVYGTMFMWIFVGVIIGFVLISLLIAPLLHPLDIKTVYQVNNIVLQIIQKDVLSSSPKYQFNAILVNIRNIHKTSTKTAHIDSSLDGECIH